jgi:hypothetical protein
MRLALDHEIATVRNGESGMYAPAQTTVLKTPQKQLSLFRLPTSEGMFGQEETKTTEKRPARFLSAFSVYFVSSRCKGLAMHFLLAQSSELIHDSQLL